MICLNVCNVIMRLDSKIQASSHIKLVYCEWTLFVTPEFSGNEVTLRGTKL